MNSNLKNAAPQLLFGLCVLLVGCLFLLENMGFLTFHFWDFWPAVFVFIGVGRLIQADTTSGRVVGVLFTVGGFVWILYNLDLIYTAPWQYWPVLLIFLGALLIWRTLGGHSAQVSRVAEKAPQGEDAINMVAVMGGFKRIISTHDFRGGALTAFMGGCEVDLRDASISSGVAVIDVFAFWGGIEMRVPDDWTIEIRAVPILGGIESKAQTPSNDNKRLVIKGMTIMGGLEVRN